MCFSLGHIPNSTPCHNLSRTCHRKYMQQIVLPSYPHLPLKKKTDPWDQDSFNDSLVVYSALTT